MIWKLAVDESYFGCSSVIIDDMMASVEAKILENIPFSISTLSNVFSEFSRSVLYEIVFEKLQF